MYREGRVRTEGTEEEGSGRMTRIMSKNTLKDGPLDGLGKGSPWQ